jgi:hypothetical protein
MTLDPKPGQSRPSSDMPDMPDAAARQEEPVQEIPKTLVGHNFFDDKSMTWKSNLADSPQQVSVPFRNDLIYPSDASWFTRHMAQQYNTNAILPYPTQLSPPKTAAGLECNGMEHERQNIAPTC